MMGGKGFIPERLEPMNIEDIASRYIDGADLSGEEVAALKTKVECDPLFAKELGDQLGAENMLSADEGWEGRISSLLSAKIAEVRPLAAARPFSAERILFRWALPIAASIALVSAIVWGLMQDPSVLMTVESASGDVCLPSRGRSFSGAQAKGVRLKPGGTAATSADSSLELSYPDGSRLSLGSETEMRSFRAESGQKAVFLQKGLLRLDCKAQKTPMILATAHVQIKILGTRIELESDEKQTRLDVMSGKVEMKSIGSGETVIVGDREAALADSSGAVERTGLKFSAEWEAFNGAQLSKENVGGSDLITLGTGGQSLRDAKMVKTIILESVGEIVVKGSYKADGFDSVGGMIVFQNQEKRTVGKGVIIPFSAKPAAEEKIMDAKLAVPSDAATALCVFYVNGKGVLELKGLDVLTVKYD